MQIQGLIRLISSLYLIESKKVISLSFALESGCIELTTKLFLNFILGNILLILIFFFQKKYLSSFSLV